MTSGTKKSEIYLQFAADMRRRFPAADFERMLAGTSLETILICLRREPCFALINGDMNLLRSLCDSLAHESRRLRHHLSHQRTIAELEEVRSGAVVHITEDNT